MDHLLEEDSTPGDLVSSLHAKQPVMSLQLPAAETAAGCTTESRLAASSTGEGLVDTAKAHRL